MNPHASSGADLNPCTAHVTKSSRLCHFVGDRNAALGLYFDFSRSTGKPLGRLTRG